MLLSGSNANVEDIVQDFCGHFVEAVLISDDIVIFATHIDIFAQYGKNIDDCAHMCSHVQPEVPTGFILHEKNGYGSFSKSVVVRVGKFEMLVLGGFIGGRHGTLKPSCIPSPGMNWTIHKSASKYGYLLPKFDQFAQRAS